MEPHHVQLKTSVQLKRPTNKLATVKYDIILKYLIAFKVDEKSMME